jgi:hypothetical protein
MSSGARFSLDALIGRSYAAPEAPAGLKDDIRRAA